MIHDSFLHYMRCNSCDLEAKNIGDVESTPPWVLLQNSHIFENIRKFLSSVSTGSTAKERWAISLTLSGIFLSRQEVTTSCTSTMPASSRKRKTSSAIPRRCSRWKWRSEKSKIRPSLPNPGNKKRTGNPVFFFVGSGNQRKYNYESKTSLHFQLCYLFIF